MCEWLKVPGHALHKLGRCAGFMTRELDTDRKAWVVVHQEHRMVLTAAWAAGRSSVLRYPCTLVRLDAHEDFGLDDYDYEEAAKRLATIEDAILFANALHPDDGGWVEAAVKLGIVTDVLTIGVHQDGGSADRRAIELNGSERRILHIPWESPSDIDTETKKLIRRLFAHGASQGHLDSEPSDLWLDIDLEIGRAHV